MGWISVSENMPERNGNYLCNVVESFHGIPQKCIRIFWYNIMSKCWDCEDSDGIVTHWMPLPEFHKEIII